MRPLPLCKSPICLIFQYLLTQQKKGVKIKIVSVVGTPTNVAPSLTMLKTKTFLIDFEILWFEKVKLVCHRGFHKCVWSGFLHLVVSYYYSFLLFRREVSSRFVNIIFREEFQMCSLLLQIRVSLHNVHS